MYHRSGKYSILPYSNVIINIVKFQSTLKCHEQNHNKQQTDGSLGITCLSKCFVSVPTDEKQARRNVYSQY